MEHWYYHIALNFRGTKFSRIGHLQIFAEIIFVDQSMSEDSGMTRYGIEVLQSLIFAVGNESAKTMKIKCLENLVLYGIYSNSYFMMLATLKMKAAMTSAKDSAPASGPLTTLSVGPSLSLSSSC